MTKVLGVILAGGQGSRLGHVIKANIPLAGHTLLTRVRTALSPQSERLLVSTGPFQASDFHDAGGVELLPDGAFSGAGPVSGLAAAVAWWRDEGETFDFVLTAAVDTPFFPVDFAARALELLTAEIDCVMGAENGQTYPTNAIWRAEALRTLPELVLNGDAPRGLKSVVPRARTLYLDFANTPESGCFANVNTPAELAALEEAAMRRD